MAEIRPFPGTEAPRLCAPRPIRVTDDRNHFDCGHDALNDWLRSKSVFSEGRSARTFVVCDGPRVVGYYCVASGAVRKDEAPKKMRWDMPDPIPVAVLGRLAVDNDYKGMKIGAGLMKHALAKTFEASQLIGIRALLVHAIDQAAIGFYLQYGFKPFPAGQPTLFLQTSAIEAAIA